MGGNTMQRTLDWFHRIAIVCCLAAAGVTAWLLWRHHARYATFDLELTGRGLVPALVSAVICLLVLAVVVFRPERARPASLRLVSGAWTLALVAALAAMCAIVWTEMSYADWSGALVQSKTHMERTLGVSLAGRPDDRYVVPTGLLVQSVEFLSANNVRVGGYIWQRYAKDIPASIERGVILPEAEDSYEMTLAYTRDLGDATLYGWYFNSVLRQDFDYRDYPLDRQIVWLRLWPKEFYETLMLVPDFTAYSSVDPRNLPGVDNQLVYGGWDPYLSGFSVAKHAYGTDFGYQTGDRDALYPDLYFDLGLKRDFLSPLFKHLPFFLAISSLMFATLVMTSNEPSAKERFQLTPSGVVAANGALLFAVIVEHNNIRDTVGSQQLSYIEVLPFTLYAMILLVSLNAVIVDGPKPIPFFEWENNLLPVVLFWPILIGILCLATWAVFFR
ncbi:MAG: hypothetical protein IT337_07175 [Thermomicrobiales bacterium]|nr:hypothetical protein [Thermomicrobiales bacterium]